MCGIVGIVTSSSRISAALERATAAMAHRGPDDSGTVVIERGDHDGGRVGLGCRRLAIVDFSSGGHQPMHDRETGNWLVFNGEIYNHQGIRTRLENDGVAFIGKSDTEVVLKAYSRWGEQCLQQFQGIFAFAIWNSKHQHLFVARDPIGVKPLYYAALPGSFIFASEVRSILATKLVSARVSREGMYSYLTFGSVWEPCTLVEGVRLLAPGHFLLWKQGQAKCNRYWTPFPKNVGARQGVRQKEVFERDLQGLLQHCVEKQARSEVPLAIFLSGGIDSSSLVALARNLGIAPNTFSLVFDEPAYSEAPYSRMVAQQFQTHHHEVVVSEHEALNALHAALSAMDQPSVDGFNTYLVCQAARRAGFKVALSGLGADEMFGRYATFLSVPYMERFAQAWCYLPSFMRSSLAAVCIQMMPGSDQKSKLASLLRGRDCLHPYLLARTLFLPDQVNKMLSNWQHLDASATFTPPWMREVEGLDPVNRVSYLEARGCMLNTLLRDADVMSMAHGVELRVPFLDPKLVELLFTLRGEWKLDSKLPKHLLIKALPKPLPSEVVGRRKRGFELPFEHWLRGSMRHELEATFAQIERGPLSDVFNADGIKDVWGRFLARKTSWSRPWSLFVLQRWCETNSVAA
jgi:asparagine synthase (glutamine-hydrolysing)